MIKPIHFSFYSESNTKNDIIIVELTSRVYSWKSNRLDAYYFFTRYDCFIQYIDKHLNILLFRLYCHDFPSTTRTE